MLKTKEQILDGFVNFPVLTTDKTDETMVCVYREDALLAMQMYKDQPKGLKFVAKLKIDDVIKNDKELAAKSNLSEFDQVKNESSNLSTAPQDGKSLLTGSHFDNKAQFVVNSGATEKSVNVMAGVMRNIFIKDKFANGVTYPLRVGRKQKRALLDANGIEIVIFGKGQEELAQLTCDLLNYEHKGIMHAWNFRDRNFNGGKNRD